MKLRYVWLVKHMPEDFYVDNNAHKDRKSCQIPQNSLKKFQSNEELVQAKLCFTQNCQVSVCQNFAVTFDQKLLNFWLAACNSTEGKKNKQENVNIKTEENVWAA